MENKINVFDLDNTLVFTDKLNNESYNFALSKLGKENICDVKRITRSTVFERFELTEVEKQQIVTLKQEYFINNINKIETNDELISKLMKLDYAKCVLWTRAEKIRAEAIMKYLSIDKAFSNVVYSSKQNIEEYIKFICSFYKCQKDYLVFYDDLM